jgi:hypothetical protein
MVGKSAFPRKLPEKESREKAFGTKLSGVRGRESAKLRNPHITDDGPRTIDGNRRVAQRPLAEPDALAQGLAPF